MATWSASPNASAATAGSTPRRSASAGVMTRSYRPSGIVSVGAATGVPRARLEAGSVVDAAGVEVAGATAGAPASATSSLSSAHDAVTARRASVVKQVT